MAIIGSKKKKALIITIASFCAACLVVAAPFAISAITFARLPETIELNPSKDVVCHMCVWERHTLNTKFIVSGKPNSTHAVEVSFDVNGIRFYRERSEGFNDNLPTVFTLNRKIWASEGNYVEKTLISSEGTLYENWVSDKWNVPQCGKFVDTVSLEDFPKDANGRYVASGYLQYYVEIASLDGSVINAYLADCCGFTTSISNCVRPRAKYSISRGKITFSNPSANVEREGIHC